MKHINKYKLFESLGHREKDSEKTYTKSDVVSLLMEALMDTLGDEWVPQEDDNFKSFLSSNGLLKTFEEEYPLYE